MLKSKPQTAQLLVLTTAIGLMGGVTRAEAAHAGRVFNVQSYGATGNGATDDTSAIQAAIAAAGTNTGNTVYFPAGTYLYSSALSVTGLTVLGQNAVLLSANSSANLTLLGSNDVVQSLTFQSKVTTGYGIKADSATAFTVADNTFGSTFNIDILVNNCTGGSIGSNSIGVSNGAGVYIFNSNGITVRKNQISEISSAYGIFENVSRNNTILENVIQAATSATTAYDIYSYQCSSNTISRNIVSGGAYGIYAFTDSGSTLSYNNISGTSQNGIINGYTTDASLTNNTLTNIGQEAVLVASSKGTCTVTNNQINGAGANGIEALGGANITVSQNSIVNCGLTTATIAVIYVDQPTAKSSVITSNTYRGNTKKLTYFIDSVQPSPPAVVFGNKTKTLLPTKVGP